MKHTSRLFTFLALFTLLPTAAHAASPVYVVAAGDTLSKIAREHQTTVSQLMQVNQLNTDRLAIGQTLTLAGVGVPDESVGAPPDLAATSDAKHDADSSPADVKPESSDHNARITGDVVNVRRTPSLDAKILGKLHYGDTVEVVEAGDDWTKIKYEDDKHAYVSSTYLSSTPLPDLPEFSGDVDTASLRRLEAVIQPLLNTPYVLGGTTTSGFDCSGFTSYVFQKLGVHLPRTSEEQFGGGKKISLDEAQPGDLLFYDALGKGRVSHVAIYMGNGVIVHANGDDVRFGKVEYMHKLYPFYGVKRYLDFQ
ncbi:NlpC/P60 family protein [Brevibacillus choshinensis]|uniref:C40 family peptidase n=1 Tax=Brevibacillus choshinensis TaxID=54911 RepID=UPI002E2011EB|nr:NlpC/P60 family protein [Brevibacillus choshinensis]